MSDIYDLENDAIYGDFHESVSNILIKKIAYEFDVQNMNIFRHMNQSLTMPNFHISFAKSRWGQWDKTNNTISLSVYLFRKFPWPAVVKVLKHEMAHMIVSDIFVAKQGLDDCGKHHGELFKKACEILGLEYSRCESCHSLQEYEIPDRERIVKRVKKLMALGDKERGGTEEESKSALSKAYKLMEEHNIASIETERTDNHFIARPVGTTWKKIPTYIKVLANVVSSHYFVKHIFVQRNYGTFIEFFGQTENLDIAEYVFHYLLQEGERQWKDFQKTDEYKNRYEGNDSYGWVWSQKERDYVQRTRRKSKYSKAAFLEGLYSGYGFHLEATKDKIHEEREQAYDAGESNTLPVLMSDPLLNEKYRKHYPNTRSMARTRGSSGGGRGEGTERGGKIRVRHGVKGNSGSGPKLLT
jgi:hypothetical protein